MNSWHFKSYLDNKRWLQSKSLSNGLDFCDELVGVHFIAGGLWKIQNHMLLNCNFKSHPERPCAMILTKSLTTENYFAKCTFWCCCEPWHTRRVLYSLKGQDKPVLPGLWGKIVGLWHEGCWCQKVTDDPLSELDSNGSIAENLQVILGQLASTIEANELNIHFFLSRMNEIIRLVKML